MIFFIDLKKILAYENTKYHGLSNENNMARDTIFPGIKPYIVQSHSDKHSMMLGQK